MMRALLAAFALAIAVGAAPRQAAAMLEIIHPDAALEPVPAAILLVANGPTPVVAKRCTSRGGVRRQRSYYTNKCV